MAWCSPSRSTMRELSYSFIWQPWVSMKSLRVMLRAGVVQKMTGDYMPTTEQGTARTDDAGQLDCSGDLRRDGGLTMGRASWRGGECAYGEMSGVAVC